MIPLLMNVTNKIPTEPAPNGLNYFIDVEDPSVAIPETMMGLLASSFNVGDTLSPKKLKDFPFRELEHSFITDKGRDQLTKFGYNYVGALRNWGPAIWGDRIQGSNFTLPQVITIFSILQDVGDTAFELFTDEFIISDKVFAFSRLADAIRLRCYHSRVFNCEVDYNKRDVLIVLTSTTFLPDCDLHINLFTGDDGYIHMNFSDMRNGRNIRETLDWIYGDTWNKVVSACCLGPEG